MRIVPVALMLGLLALLAGSASAGVIIDNSTSFVKAEFQSQPNNGSQQTFYSNSGSATATAPTAPAWGASTTSALFGPAGVTVSFDQMRTGGQYNSSSGQNVTYFTATGNDAYSISGSYTSSYGYTHLGSSLYDLANPNTPLFSNLQINQTATTLTLGNVAGNISNSIAGDWSGNLIAGHQYKWSVFAYIWASPYDGHGATATGNLKIQFTSVTTPEPASLAIWGGLGVIGLLAARRRRRLKP